ncbi:MAG: hypothetical protein HOH43_04785 [Candidatus Latescibacteria bacterium]|nr:hypothetical protein [Candidatus Latescibacterota bacterium]
MTYSESLSLTPGGSNEVSFVVPDVAWPVQDIGIEISGQRASGAWYLEGLWISGQPHHTFPNHPDLGPGGNPIGWISDVDQLHLRAFSSDDREMMRIGHNNGSGVMITGNRDWKDYTFETNMSIHLARSAGIIARYQGLQRHIMLVQTDGWLRLIERYHGDSVLAQIAVDHEPDTFHLLSLHCEGDQITAMYDGQRVLEGQSNRLNSGGAGFLVEQGLVGFRDTTIKR